MTPTATPMCSSELSAQSRHQFPRCLPRLSCVSLSLASLGVLQHYWL